MPSRRLLVLLLLSVPAPGFAAESLVAHLESQISGMRLMGSVRDLSQFDGRQSGTSGGDQAAAYIAARLPHATLQSFPIKTYQITSPLQATIENGRQARPLQIGSDFLPILNGASATIVSAPILFVGYGISDHAHGLDEYEGQSATGKIVLFLRGQPKSYVGRASHAEKVNTAHTKGAVAYLTVTGPVLSGYERRRGLSQAPMMLYESETGGTLSGLWIAPSVADQLLLPIGTKLESFQEAMDRAPRSRSKDSGSTMSLHIEQRERSATASNVVAFLPGSDPDLQNEIILLGAHYDHFGVQGGLLFPGGDDNASGTAILLELGRLLASSEGRPKRGVLFVAFAGEEQGLLGSNYYVSHPARPLDGTKAMVNVDHAGAGDGKITIGLSEIQKATAEAAAETAGVAGHLEVFGFFPGGDHVPFAKAGIPNATIVSSGAHPHFHRPSDTPERLNPDILLSVAQYTLSLVLALANGAR